MTVSFAAPGVNPDQTKPCRFHHARPWGRLIIYLVSIPLGIRKRSITSGSRFDIPSSTFDDVIGYAILAFLFAVLLIVFSPVRF